VLASGRGGYTLLLVDRLRRGDDHGVDVVASQDRLDRRLGVEPELRGQRPRACRT
jgi:hypothetical protein